MAKAKKEDNNGTNGISTGGELGMLRDILMGKQINEYDTRFDALEARIKERELSVQQKMEELERQLEDRTLQMQEAMLLRLSKIENLLHSTIDGANSKKEEQRIKDRRELGQMLLEMSKRFSD